MTMLRFGYSTLNWPEFSPVEPMLVDIAGAGWGAVEIFAPPLNWLGPHTRLQAQLDAAGLQVACFFGSVELPADRRQLELQQRRIDYAAAVGATAHGLVGGSRRRERAPTAAEHAELADWCEELAVYAAAQGVTLCYHPHTGCTIETEAETDRLLDAAPHLMLCLDASHVALAGEDPLRQFRKYGSRLGYVHLKDWTRGHFTEMGQGTLGIDFPAILRELAAQQFDGWVIVEQSRSDVSPAASAQVNAAYLQSLGYRLR